VAAARKRAIRSLRGQKSSDVLSLEKIEGAVVVSAEEVADYVDALPAGTDITDVVSSVAPPFERMFIEFQNRRGKDMLALDSWGVLIEGERTDDGWELNAALVGELQKGKPFGPLVRWVAFTDREGLLRRQPFAAEEEVEGYGTVLVRGHSIPGVPDEATYEFVNDLVLYLCSAFFTLSLMHCKNVDVRQVDPPERLSRKHERRHGRPLASYYVLSVKPIGRVLDTEGEAQTKGLAHALHICRGHFKTFTEDAPLFGKRVGTYWWEAQVRGKAEEGVVEKDYRVRLDQGLGREYRRVDEHAEIDPNAPEHTGLDPDLGGRGLRAHNVTQNLVAAAVKEAGFEPRRPKPDEPQYDIAWEHGDVTWVAEVKSVTEQNEERQLRQALGQVLRYRQLLEADRRSVRAMIAVEHKPSDPSWGELCAGEGIVLAWPPIKLAP
jgi:hypothetical protein